MVREGGEGKGGKGREGAGGVGRGAGRPVGARGPALAKDGSNVVYKCIAHQLLLNYTD